jgi:hypothetical protein
MAAATGKCIFCLKEKPELGLTNEHVFPAALGGVLIIKNGSCVTCNNGCSNFEQPLATELIPLRHLLQIPDRRGEVPNTPATFKVGEKEYEARVKGDGTVQLKPVVTEVLGSGGVREFLHQFATEHQKEKLRAEAKEKGKQFIESAPGEPMTGEVHVGGDLGLIGSSEGLRTASKIAYAGLVFRAGAKLAMSDAFKEIRAYIVEGSGKPAVRAFVNYKFSSAVQQGPHQHAIILAARHDKKRVDAIVTLFGGLNYFVVLSDHYNGPDICDTLVLDAYRGEVNAILQSHVDAEILETEDVATSGGTIWNDLPTFGKFFCDFLDHAVQAKMERSRIEAARLKLRKRPRRAAHS